MDYILWLRELQKEKHSSVVGGKTMRLAELVQRGFTVPQAFCLSADIYQEYLRYNNLLRQQHLFRLDRDKSILKRLCKRLHDSILQGKIPSEIRKQINQAMRKIAADRFAVRSSATCEDLHLASFAGQFESYLDLLADQVFDGVRKCWASVFSERVLTYALFHEIDLTSIKMAVLVQEMIDAEKGGVIFTKNIVDPSDPYAIVIEASTGASDDVVSGLVEPERIIIDKKSRVERSRSSPQGRILDSKETATLVQIAMDVEDHFQGVPQDIEWAMRKGAVYLLQARPITT